MEVQKVALIYKEIYQEQTIYIYYMSENDEFEWCYNDHEIPTPYPSRGIKTKNIAIEDARYYIDTRYNFPIPKTIEEWINHFDEVIYKQNWDGTILISDKKAFEIALNKYAEWKNSTGQLIG